MDFLRIDQILYMLSKFDRLFMASIRKTDISRPAYLIFYIPECFAMSGKIYLFHYTLHLSFIFCVITSAKERWSYIFRDEIYLRRNIYCLNASSHAITCIACLNSPSEIICSISAAVSLFTFRNSISSSDCSDFFRQFFAT